MKLNLHSSGLYLYTPLGEFDGLRKFNLFEDFDEIFLNFNFDSTKKKLEYFSEITVVNENSLQNTNKKQSKNFISEYF